MNKKVIVIGAGIAGLSATIELAKQDIEVALISSMPSERAQSVMAEGGINAAINTMGEGDSPELHEKETIKAGRFLANVKAVRNMTKEAPDLIRELHKNGMCFQLERDNSISLRSFGGQTKKRTAYASTSTGKQLMHTLIQKVRYYESEKKVKRYIGWNFLKLLHKDNEVYGCLIYQRDENKIEAILGDGVVIASGGMNGLFSITTGSLLNTGNVVASLFLEGISISNGEFIQYHPTTVKLHGKNMLITEAVRAEGGRLFVLKDGKPFYFMEEKYPELGNLMPRDVISREEWKLIKEGKEIFLDMRNLDPMIYKTKLQNVIHDCIEFLDIDPRIEVINVSPGIHYFMGGIAVDEYHRTSMKRLYAAGECACQYHGANRLGGNSLLGALYGGKVAGQSVIKDLKKNLNRDMYKVPEELLDPEYYIKGKCLGVNYHFVVRELNTILQESLGIERDEESLKKGLEKIDKLISNNNIMKSYDEYAYIDENMSMASRCILGKALILSALERKESRGAHFRLDYPREREEYRKNTIAKYKKGKIEVSFSSIEGEDE